MNKKMLTALLTVLLLLSGIPAVFAAHVDPVKNKGHMIVWTIGSPETVDPAWCYDTASAEFIFNIYETLLFFATDRDPTHPGPGGTVDYGRVDKFIPMLATEWKDYPIKETSPEGLTWNWRYEFKIRTDVKFHNGETLTAEDVEYSFERWMVQDRGGGPTWMIYEPLLNEYDAKPPEKIMPPPAGDDKWGLKIDHAVEDIDTDGDGKTDTVIFNLAFPGSYPPFYQILAQSWASIINKKWAIANGDFDVTKVPGGWSNWYGIWTYDVDGDKKPDWHDPDVSMIDRIKTYPAPSTAMVGTGPYKLNYWDKVAKEWSFVRDPTYRRGWPAPIEEGVAGLRVGGYVDRVTIKEVADWVTRRDAFLVGDIDLTYVPRGYISQLYEGLDMTKPVVAGIRGIKGMPTMTYDAIFFTFDIATLDYIGTGEFDKDGNGIPDGTTRKFFSDLRIRKAFAHSFDYTAYLWVAMLSEAKQPSNPIIETLGGGDPRAAQSLGVVINYGGYLYNGTYLPATPKHSIDLTKAASLFKAASADPASPAYGVWEKGFYMKALYNTGNIPRKLACEEFRDQLKKVNPKFIVEVTEVSWPEFLTALVYSKLPLFMVGWLADYPDPHNFVHPFMHSKGAFAAWQKYSNATVDAMIAEGIRMPASDARTAHYWKIAQEYYRAAPSIGRIYPIGRHWERDWVQGWYYNPIYPGDYFYHMWKEHIASFDGDNYVYIKDASILNVNWRTAYKPTHLTYKQATDCGSGTLEKGPDELVYIQDAAVLNAYWKHQG